MRYYPNAQLSRFVGRSSILACRFGASRPSSEYEFLVCLPSPCPTLLSSFHDLMNLKKKIQCWPVNPVFPVSEAFSHVSAVSGIRRELVRSSVVTLWSKTHLQPDFHQHLSLLSRKGIKGYCWRTRGQCNAHFDVNLLNRAQRPVLFRLDNRPFCFVGTSPYSHQEIARVSRRPHWYTLRHLKLGSSLHTQT